MPHRQAVKPPHATGRELSAEVKRVLGRDVTPSTMLGVQNGNIPSAELKAVVDRYHTRMLRAQAKKAQASA